jgi:soluble lytic murein transglycosylase-like protein
MSKLRILIVVSILITFQNSSVRAASVYRFIDGKFVNVLTGKDLDRAKRFANNSKACRGGLTSDVRRQYCPIVRRTAEHNNIDPAIFEAMILCESAYKSDAVSSANAFGFTQLMESTAVELGVDRENPIENISGGANYLDLKYREFGNWQLALAAYNAGAGAVQKYGGIPPYRETINYVSRVMKTAALPELESCGLR